MQTEPDHRATSNCTQALTISKSNIKMSSTGAKRQFYREVDGLIYRTATSADSEIVWNMLVAQFYPRIAITPYLEMKVPEDYEFDHAQIPDIVKEGVSLVVEDAATKQVIGARLSSIELRENANLKHPLVSDPAVASRYPKHSIIFRMFDELTSSIDLFKRYNVSRMLSFKFLVVSESHAGRGIAKKLVQFSLEVAKDFNLELVNVFTGNRYSERIYNSLGFDRLNVVHLADFVDPMSGDKPFARLNKEALEDSVLYAIRV